MHAALLSGPPGIGKTTAAVLVSKEEGFKVCEFNASDTRSKNRLQEVLGEMIRNSNITSFMGKKEKTAKTVIVMDEVDGMSAGDRGGVAQLIQFIKKTKAIFFG